MRKIVCLLTMLCLTCFSALAQDDQEDIVFIVDELRYAWDDEAVKLETFEGMEEFCHVKSYKREITDLLNKIHHYDTTLYNIVSSKYDASEDAAAKETLDDIILIESKYTTKNFLEFLDFECDKVKTIEKHLRKPNNDVDAEMGRLERELTRYIEAVTLKIDLVDEHIHHLKDL